MALECNCTPVRDVEYDVSSDTSPSDAIVRAIAAVSDTEPTDLTPLYDTIDTEALNRLFDGRTRESDAGGKILSFAVSGWNVFVRDDGRIRVCDPSGPDDPSPIFD